MEINTGKGCIREVYRKEITGSTDRNVCVREATGHEARRNRRGCGRIKGYTLEGQKQRSKRNHPNSGIIRK